MACISKQERKVTGNMSGLIPQHFIDDLITRADIVEVIGSRIQLKKAGREFKACCPFHGEKTPSFTVSPSIAWVQMLSSTLPHPSEMSG